jgi:hypothetical protein
MSELGISRAKTDILFIVSNPAAARTATKSPEKKSETILSDGTAMFAHFFCGYVCTFCSRVPEFSD